MEKLTPFKRKIYGHNCELKTFVSLSLSIVFFCAPQKHAGWLPALPAAHTGQFLVILPQLSSCCNHMSEFCSSYPVSGDATRCLEKQTCSDRDGKAEIRDSDSYFRQFQEVFS
ncbi:hypothetical protein CHARACLAT_000454 [Characodon lateralis]|uniref:Uncharacterized protein n=1 Tax=Characodon lateralis TaxID=208331 RepID=A0ABU7DEZ7_9TELE|nr:hypothetical protein [Characodon lateralis]